MNKPIVNSRETGVSNSIKVFKLSGSIAIITQNSHETSSTIFIQEI